jgi:hypothetical protein
MKADEAQTIEEIKRVIDNCLEETQEIIGT